LKNCALALALLIFRAVFDCGEAEDVVSKHVWNHDAVGEQEEELLEQIRCLWLVLIFLVSESEFELYCF